MSPPTAASERPAAGLPSSPAGHLWDGLIVLCAVNAWEGMKLHDRHLAEALAPFAPILYVNPPASHLTRFNDPSAARSLRRPRLRQVAPRIAAFTPLVPPKPMQPAVLPLTSRLVRRQLRRAVHRLGGRVEAVVSNWMFVEVFGLLGERSSVYWWTDDPVDAAALWRRDPRRLAAADRCLTERADLVATVSGEKTEELRAQGVAAAHLPNGCDADFYTAVDGAPDPPDLALPAPIAGFVGRLNHRTDLSLLEAIAAAGISLLLIGPRDSAFEPERFEALCARENVAWLGARRFEELLPYLKRIDVGIVPYADTQFNRNSFPLKTLEYLAAGRPVVSTPLPALRWLDTDLITLAAGPEDFVAAVLRQAPEARRPGLVEARRAVARRHSWAARAAQLAGLLGLDSPPARGEQDESDR